MSTPAAHPPLAIHGGTPVRQTPFAGWPHYSEAQIAAVTEVLRSGQVNYWTGDRGRAFEQAFAEYCGARYGIAVCNGTVALELALRAAGVKPGDEVITGCRSYIACAGAAVACGAVPVLVDVDPVNQNLDPAAVEGAITPRTRAIVAVHLAGWPCDMDRLTGIAQRYDLKLIEDCAQAHGASYRGRPAGTLGHVAAFSFCQDKIMTTGGEGGLIATDDPEIMAAAWSYRDNGKDPERMAQETEPGLYRWIHGRFGTNARMTETQAVLGLKQLEQVDHWLATRRRNARFLDDALERIPGIRVTRPPEEIRHAYYRYYAFIDPARLRKGWTHARVIQAISAEGVPCFHGSCPDLGREPAFRPYGAAPADRPAARALGESALMFLVHPTLDERDMADTARAVERVMAEAVD